MIKTIIIDDEYLIRQQLITSINWNSLGFQLVGEASDGEAALELTREKSPDLLILDINIPIINGLALANIIHKEQPWVTIVLLTGYESFDCARQAISAGVAHYLVKPINAEEITRTLINIKSERKKTKRIQQYVRELEIDIADSRENTRTDFLRSILFTRINNQSIEQKFIYYGITMLIPPVNVALIEIDYFFDRWPDLKDRQLWLYAITNIAEEIFDCQSAGIAFQLDEQYTAIFFSEHSNNLELCNQIISVVKELLDLSITVGISQAYSDYSMLPSAYQEAKNALLDKFFAGTGKILECSNCRKSIALERMITPDESEFISSHLNEENINAVSKKVEDIYNRSLDYGLNKDCFIIVFIDIIRLLGKYLADKNTSISNLALEGSNDFIRHLKTRETAIEVKDWTIKLFEIAVDNTKQNGSKASRLSIKAKNLIEVNYQDENLSPFSIANSIFVQPTYLSRIFKKDYNQSIISYIIEYRMNKAKNIIDENRNIQITDLAKLCGYSDPFYFSRSFKKCFGISPSDYLRAKHN